MVRIHRMTPFSITKMSITLECSCSLSNVNQVVVSVVPICKGNDFINDPLMFSELLKGLKIKLSNKVCKSTTDALFLGPMLPYVFGPHTLIGKEYDMVVLAPNTFTGPLINSLVGS